MAFWGQKQRERETKKINLMLRRITSVDELEPGLRYQENSSYALLRRGKCLSLIELYSQATTPCVSYMHKEREMSPTARNNSAAAKILPEKGVLVLKKTGEHKNKRVSCLMQANSLDTLPSKTADNCFNVQQNGESTVKTQTPRRNSLAAISFPRDPSVTGLTGLKRKLRRATVHQL